MTVAGASPAATVSVVELVAEWVVLTAYAEVLEERLARAVAQGDGPAE